MSADDPQLGLPLDLKTRDPLVRRALLIMQQNLDTPPGVGDIAARLCVSRRKLERHMREALGLTPAEAFTRVRLAHARFLLARPGTASPASPPRRAFATCRT